MDPSSSTYSHANLEPSTELSSFPGKYRNTFYGRRGSSWLSRNYIGFRENCAGFVKLRAGFVKLSYHSSAAFVQLREGRCVGREHAASS